MCPSIRPSARAADLRPVGELARLAESCTIAAASRRSRSSRGCSVHSSLASVATATVCSRRPPEVGVVAAPAAAGRPGRQRARRAANPARSSRSPSSRPSSAPDRRVVDLAREVLEEPLQLVEVAAGDAAESAPGRRRGRRRARSLDARSGAARGSGPPDRRREPARRARSARPAHRRHGTLARGSSRCCRAARASGRASRTAIWRSLRVHAKTAVDVARRGAAWRPFGGAADSLAPAAAIVPSCTVIRMQPLIWDRRPDGLRAPAMICAFKAGTTQATPPPARSPSSAPRWSQALRADRLRGLLRLPGQPPDDQARRARQREIVLAERRDLRSAASTRAA